MVMGSFTQKYVLIQTDQSGSREGRCGHKLTNQREGRVCKVKLTNQNFLKIRMEGGGLSKPWMASMEAKKGLVQPCVLSPEYNIC